MTCTKGPGSSDVVHLHGQLMKARSTLDSSLVYPMQGWQLKEGDRCERGSQLRPHIVWFGEDVPLMPLAVSVAETADVIVIVGTSLQVCPAANLAFCVRPDARRILIDPNPPAVDGFEVIRCGAAEGLSKVSWEDR